MFEFKKALSSLQTARGKPTMHIKLFSFTKTGSRAKQARFPKGGKRKSISNKSENGGLLYLKMKLWFRSFKV